MMMRQVWFMGLLLLDVGPALADGQAPQSELVVTVSANRARIAVDAKDAPLQRVLDELASRLGATLHHSLPTDARLTATCGGEQLKAILECVLGGSANLLFRGTPGIDAAGNPKKQEVWILGSGTNAMPPPDSIKSINKREGGAVDKQRLLDLAASDDPSLRADAFSQLTGAGASQDPAVRQMLAMSLQDEDPRVRAQAVYGLSRQSGPEATAVLQEALQDSDADVRLMAVDSIGSEEGSVELLKAALNDSDETVRQLAAMKLAGVN